MDKQIEEMAKDLYGHICGKVKCQECNYNGDSEILGPFCPDYTRAKHLIQKGYRKIPEIPKNTVLTNDDIAELLTIVAKDTRKETAEKFAERLKKLYPDKQTYKNFYWCIDEICKEFTEGKE